MTALFGIVNLMLRRDDKESSAATYVQGLCSSSDDSQGAKEARELRLIKLAHFRRAIKTAFPIGGVSGVELGFRAKASGAVLDPLHGINELFLFPLLLPYASSLSTCGKPYS